MGLKLENVCKSYGTKQVVDHISFELNKPGIFGLLGTNGAGKTTTIRMILGILNKNSGNITWNNKEVKRETVNFGYLPEERGLYPKTKVKDQLIYFAELRGLTKETALKEITKWAPKLKIDEYLEMTADKLSKGNQQKVQFLASIIHNPELIILDEPFSGLDPVNSELLKEVIIELVKQGKYIIMSAHEMHTIEEFCTDLLILNKGKTVLKGNLKEIRNSYPANRVLIEADKDINSIIKKHKLTIENSHDSIYVVKITNDAEAHALLKDIIKENVNVNKFEITRPTLNDIFIEKVGK